MQCDVGFKMSAAHKRGYELVGATFATGAINLLFTNRFVVKCRLFRSFRTAADKFAADERCQ